MKRVFHILVAVIAVILLAACATVPPRLYIDQEWNRMPAPTSVKVVFATPADGSPILFKRNFPEYEDRFDEWFNQYAFSKLKETTKNRFKLKMLPVDDVEVTFETVKLGENDFPAPKFEGIERDADVYLVINYIWFGLDPEHEAEKREKVDPNALNIFTPDELLEYRLISHCRYAFYDTKSKKLLGYGSANGFSSGKSIDKENWIFILDKLMDDMLWSTPLYTP